MNRWAGVSLYVCVAVEPGVMSIAVRAPVAGASWILRPSAETITR